MFEQKITDALRAAGCPSRYMAADFGNYKIYNEKQGKFVETIKSGKGWLCLTGETGTGKTHLAIALMRKVLTETKNTAYCIYSPVKKIIDGILAADFARKQEMLTNLSAADLLIIDEIGRSIETKYFQDVIFEIVNNRYNEYKQTVIISNLSSDELFGKYFDTATARRISEMGAVLQFDFEHYEGAK